MVRLAATTKKVRPVYSDQERLKAAHKAGDSEGMALALLDIAGSIIRSQAHKIPHSLDHDDLAQEAVVEALANLAKYDASKGTLRNFVYGSVRFTILDRTRKEIRRTLPLQLGLHRFAGAY